MAVKSPWRMYARQVIRRVREENPGLEDKALRRKVSEAYPFGERAMHPYKIWLDEVARTFGTKKKKHKVSKDVNYNQPELF